MSDDLQDTVEIGVIDSIDLRASGKKGGKAKVTVHYTGGDGEQVLYADTHPKDFVEKPTPRGQIKNGVRDAIADKDGVPVDPDAWVTAWSDTVTSIMAESDGAKADVVPESVRELARGTEYVHVSRGGDTRTWRIRVTWNGRTGEITLDHNDMAGGGVTTLKSQLYREFLDSPDLEQADWDALRDYWLDMQEEVASEYMTEVDMAVERFRERLKRRITPYDTPDVLPNEKENAWVDMANTHGLRLNGQSDDIDGVVWVRNSLVHDLLDDLEIGVAELGEELGTRGWTVRSSENLQPAGKDSKARYWFFAVDELGISDMDIHSAEERSDGDAPGEVSA